MEHALGAVSRVGALGHRTKKRYDDYSKTLLEAPYTEPGEPVMPNDAQAFLAKRAALQNTEKTAVKKELTMGQKALKMLFANPGKAALVGGSLVALNELTGPTMESWGKRIQKKFVPSIRERASLDAELADSYAKSVGKELGKKTVGLLGDVLSKAIQAPSELFGSRARAGVFEMLKKEDDVISQADPQQLAESYHTMVRFAPTLATDKNAVKTFLRESTLYGTGPNFMSIKQLAEAERAINPPALVKVSR